MTKDSAAARPIAAVILAGGFGTRIRHLLEDVPKPMASVAGRPFLEWVVRFYRAQGIRRIVLSTGYLSEVVARHFASMPVPDVDVVCVPEITPLGTAGGFLNAVAGSTFNSPFWLVANGDSLALTSLDAFLAEITSEGASATMLALAVTDASRFGTVEVTQDNRLVKFAEKTPGAGLISAGVYLLKASTLELFPTMRPLSFETQVFPNLLECNAQILVHAVEARFLDIGTPASLAEASQFVESNLNYFA